MQCRAGDTFVTQPSPLPMARALSPVFHAVSITLEKTHSPNSPNTIMVQHHRRPAHNWSAQPQRALRTHSPWNPPVPSLPTPRKHHTAPSTHCPPPPVPPTEVGHVPSGGTSRHLSFAHHSGRNTAANTRPSIPLHQSGPQDGGLAGPKAAGARGPYGPGGRRAASPGAMLRRCERTARWRRARGGG